jgi:hypothetical protein
VNSARERELSDGTVEGHTSNMPLVLLVLATHSDLSYALKQQCVSIQAVTEELSVTAWSTGH